MVKCVEICETTKKRPPESVLFMKMLQHHQIWKAIRFKHPHLIVHTRFTDKHALLMVTKQKSQLLPKDDINKDSILIFSSIKDN